MRTLYATLHEQQVPARAYDNVVSLLSECRAERSISDDEVQGVAVGPKRLSADLDGTYTERFFARQKSIECKLTLVS